MSQPELSQTDSQPCSLSQDSNSINPDDLLIGVNTEQSTKYLNSDIEKLLQNPDVSVGSDLSQIHQDSLSQISPVKPSGVIGTAEKGQILENFPPGLNVFHNEYGFKHFTAESLSLEKHFEYNARDRLANAMCGKLSTEQLLSNPIVLATTLESTNANSLLIRSQSDFLKIANYLFFCISCTEVENDRELLSKAFFNMLKNYGYTWKLTPEHIVMVLENLRVNRLLMFNTEFFKTNFQRGPPAPFLLMKTRTSSVSYKPIAILNVLGLLKEIICRGLYDCSCFSELKMVLWTFFVVCQHKELACDGSSSTVGQELIASLLHMAEPLTEARLKEISVLLSIGFKPTLLSRTARNWTSINMSKRMQQQGHNHPLNYVYGLALIPLTTSGVRIKTIMAFLSAQVILGIEEVQCPSRMLFSFVWDMLRDNPDQWEELKSNQTVMRAFVCLLDVLERNLYTPLNLNSRKADSLRSVQSLLSSYVESLPRMNADELDTIQLRRILSEVDFRWARKLLPLKEDERFGRQLDQDFDSEEFSD